MDLDQGFQELLIELPNAGDVDTKVMTMCAERLTHFLLSQTVLLEY